MDEFQSWDASNDSILPSSLSLRTVVVIKLSDIPITAASPALVAAGTVARGRKGKGPLINDRENRRAFPFPPKKQAAFLSFLCVGLCFPSGIDGIVRSLEWSVWFFLWD